MQPHSTYRLGLIGGAAFALAACTSWAQTPDILWQDTLESGSVSSVAYGPDGRLAVGSGFFNCGGEGGYGDCFGEGGFSIYAADTGELLVTRMPFEGAATDAEFSPDGSLLAVSAGYEDVQIRQTSDGALVRTLFVQDGAASQVRFSADGSLLFVATQWGFQSGLAVYRVSDGELVNTFDLVDPEIGSIALSPDGTRIAVADYPLIKIFDTGNEYSLVVIENPHAEDPAWVGSLDVAFGPDGRTLASVGTVNAKLFDADTGAQLQVYNFDPEGDEGGWSIAVSPDGGAVAVGGAEAQYGIRGTINLFDAAGGQNLAHYEDQTGRVVRDIRYSPDGQEIAFVSDGDGVGGAIVAVIDNPLGGKCGADMDNDGSLTLFDFLAFQNMFARGDPAADLDADGALTLFDFLMFQNMFSQGC